MSVQVFGIILGRIRDSITGPKAVKVAKFTYSMALKYKRGGIGVSAMNMELISSTAIESEEYGGNLDDVNKRPRKKSKGQTGGRVTQGEDFWGQVDSWFVKGMSI
ncbi:hypothetical protein SERLADRAFT_479587 [Serpula lacrymans var. lacrymans S7.9]|uniref:Uncharacterized protein n=1 Tax=Serpula lacrymans var. lacrymans (strain S7.9) TaxID=578457 RepID=F8PC17_SERL9|nr:uncharacterized protein SERLADRAFT_479587 [Serpula lacrymans var. lacrymans S7.9]EGO19217.1 hypothetical protein SERLADRAFT_479587 [Serpula lacrymans var. lacrymans S7.9]